MRKINQILLKILAFLKKIEFIFVHKVLMSQVDPNPIKNKYDDNTNKSEQKSDQTNEEKVYLSEEQLNKEIKATKQRLLELIIRKNQLTVQKVKEEQAKNQSSIQQNKNPDAAQFFNQFFFLEQSNRNDRNHKHKHSKKHSKKYPPYFELLKQVKPQHNQTENNSDKRYNFESQFGRMNPTFAEKVQPPTNSNSNFNFNQNYSHPFQFYQWYQQPQKPFFYNYQQQNQEEQEEKSFYKQKQEDNVHKEKSHHHSKKSKKHDRNDDEMWKKILNYEKNLCKKNKKVKKHDEKD